MLNTGSRTLFCICLYKFTPIALFVFLRNQDVGSGLFHTVSSGLFYETTTPFATYRTSDQAGLYGHLRDICNVLIITVWLRSCQPQLFGHRCHCKRSKAIHATENIWIAASLPLLAMTRNLRNFASNFRLWRVFALKLPPFCRIRAEII